MPNVTAKTQLIEWGDLRVVLAFDGQCGLSGAAAALGLDATTVSRRMKALEQAVGAPLLMQVGKGLELSPLGEEVLESARAMRLVVDDLMRQLGANETQIAGSVKLTALNAMLTAFVLPNLASLRAAHPRVVLQMIGASRNLSIGRDEADLAIRFGRPTQAGLVGRKLFDVPYVVAGPRTAGWIAFDEGQGALPEAEWVRRHVAAADIVYRTNNSEHMAAAVHAGLARALLPQFLCSGPRSAQVVLVREAWLVMHKDTRSVPRIRAVADWLVAASESFDVKEPLKRVAFKRK
jgi:DNA-binding transcriptional LysR family regulator